MDRRHFLGALGALPLLPSLPRGMRASEHPLFAARRSPLADLDKIGLQLYTVRSRMEASVERTLYEVSRIGYREVEFAGYFGRPPRAIKQLLDRNGLEAPAAHTSLAAMRDGWFRTLSDASQMGHKWLVVPWLNASDYESIDAIKQTAATLNQAGAAAKDYDIRVAYHNHDFEFKLVEGRVIFDVLLEETDPTLIDVELDLYWITKAGADPYAYFARWPGRFPLVHVKDSAGEPDHEMTAVGKGTIDFAKLFATREQTGMKHFFVEHDNPADPMASVGTSYRYLKSLRF